MRPTRDLRRAVESLLGLAPDGVCRAVPVTGDAGGLLPHRFTLACVLRPSAVCSLLHFPSGCPAWELPSIMPYGVRTFLTFPGTGRARPSNGLALTFYGAGARLRPLHQPPRPPTAADRVASQITVTTETWAAPKLASAIRRPANTSPTTDP